MTRMRWANEAPGIFFLSFPFLPSFLSSSFLDFFFYLRQTVLRSGTIASDGKKKKKKKSGRAD